VGHVIADLSAPAQRREKAPVRSLGGARFEIEEAAPDEILWRCAEDFGRRIVEIGEAALGVGGPDEIVGRLDEIAIAVFAFE
jgi:hypothetical protein